MSETMPVQELAYDAAVQLTGEINFGIDMKSAMADPKAIPPEGVRVDVPFEGELTGPKLKGKIAGTDYLLLRGDGIAKLDIHAVITTDDGERIAFYGDGVGIAQEGSSTVQLRENVTLHTASPKYSWVNRQQFWATGQVDLSNGKITVKGYSA